jgi:hypothetical protein
MRTIVRTCAACAQSCKRYETDALPAAPLVWPNVAPQVTCNEPRNESLVCQGALPPAPLVWNLSRPTLYDKRGAPVTLCVPGEMYYTADGEPIES